MRALLLSAILFLITAETFAQRDLAAAPKTSRYTYIYRITPAEASILFGSEMDKMKESYLYDKVDSTDDDEVIPQLAPGNYLFVYAEGNRLVTELRTIGDLHVQLLSNRRDLLVAVYDHNNHTIPDAEVRIGKRKVSWDKDAQYYKRNKTRHAGLLRIRYKNTLFVFRVNSSRKQIGGFFKKVSRAFPVKYISRLFEKRRRRTPSFQRGTPSEAEYRGFVVFSKPKYKPGDTLRLKAFITTKKGKPVDRPLLLRISDDYLGTDTIVSVLHPYRSGGYTAELVLTDSLDLDLDEEYTCTLEDLSSRKIDPADNLSEMDDDEYAAKRKVLVRGKFYFEEYELGSLRFHARAQQETFSRGEEQAYYFKATDENDLPVQDGRVLITVTPSGSSRFNYRDSIVFIPDTLFTKTITLDPVGETKFILPDSIFPKVTFHYKLAAQLLNSNNESRNEELYTDFEDQRERLTIESEADSLRINYFISGKPAETDAELFAFDLNDDSLFSKKLHLPAVVPVDPLVGNYEVVTELCDEEFFLRSSRRMVSCQASRTKDSVRVLLINPKRLKVWYTLFNGEKVVARGYSTDLDLSFRTRSQKNYSISLQYVYGSRPVTDEFVIPYQDKLLNLVVDQPAYVYPGQTVNVGLQVTDQQGKPVEHADVTAYSFTTKFDRFRAPNVPYLGKIYPRRRGFNTFYPGDQPDTATEIRYTWERWGKALGLDTMEYFRFLRPLSLYINHASVKDSLTQFAPFVVLNGEIEPVQLLYLDERPLFFSQARQLQRYSFPVSPGKHSLRLRTTYHTVTLDSFWFAKGVKTILSINADTLNTRVKVSRAVDTLSSYEQILWGKYMMLVENNFGETPATISQSNVFNWINPDLSRQPGPILTGPYPDRYAVLDVANDYSRSFEAEGGYEYHFEKDLIKMKQLKYPLVFNKRLDWGLKVPGFSDLVLTEKELDSIWSDYLDQRSVKTQLFYNPALYASGNGRLVTSVSSDTAVHAVRLKNILLFRYDEPDFLRVYKGEDRSFDYQRPGKYRLMLLYAKNRYFIMDSLEVKPGGINYYEISLHALQSADSISEKIWATISSRNTYTRMVQDQDLNKIKEAFNDKYASLSLFSEILEGTVRDQNGAPVIGAMVVIKGTRFATVTSANGHFSIKAPPNAVLVVSIVGFNSMEKKAQTDAQNDFRLTPMTNALQEVVVVGYGSAQRKDITGSVSSISGDQLAGKVAGLSVTSNPGAATEIRIRGMASIQANSEALVIIDGVPVPMSSLASMDANDFASFNVLKDAAATAIYGAAASNGVIVITTKNGKASNVFQADSTIAGASKLRTRFRDDAFWQPMLRTDAQGKVNFKVTYPDDITSWRGIFIAMTDHKKTGYLENSVRAFKTLSGAIALPSFAVDGDHFNLIGKATNYGQDTVTVKRSFWINDSLKKQDMLHVRNAWIDTLDIAAKGTDSLKVKYIVEKENGFMDGEERKIPVFEQGVLETNGMFATLSKDTSFSVAMKTSGEKVKVYAESSVLPVLLQETESIRNYEYLCNEQLASKLKALLMEKRISAYLKRKFEGEKNIKDIMSKLAKNRAASGLWGWWDNSEPVMWISLHVIDALLEAEEAGYPSGMNKQLLTDYLIYQLESLHGRDRIEYVQLLFRLGAKADYKKYIDSLDAYKGIRSLYDDLAIVELKQKAGMPVVLDTLLAKQKHTMFGNVYWGEDCYRFFDNSIHNTLRMYRIIRANNPADPLLDKARNYFLEQRRTGSWRNTYESSLIMETLLPEILKMDSTAGPATLQLSGSRDMTVQKFPFTMELKPGEAFNVAKKGAAPVYFTAYHQYWNPAPDTASNGFTVRTQFVRNGEKVAQLKGGEAVTLQAEVIVKADASYIMVEIPVPAGCSYHDKSQSWYHNEVHREYFKNKVSIFCSELKQGKYTFSVSLMPRYSGVYHLNPGKAEMMYFPVFYGREKMKEIVVK